MDSEAVKTLFNYGVPTGILLIGGWVFYRLAQQAGTFMAPVITKIADAHGTFLGEIKDNQKMQTEILRSHSSKLDSIEKAVAK